MVCPVCVLGAFTAPAFGRPHRTCSNACHQAAHKERHKLVQNESRLPADVTNKR